MGKKNISLQILRILACFGVFIVHLGQRTSLRGVIRSYTDFGRFGVYMFFILSGLLATKGLDQRKDAIGYYKKRFIAIAPLYYFIILWYFVTEHILNFYFHHIPNDTVGLYWLRYIFMLNGFIADNTYFWSNLGITWTIPVFCFFYMIVPWAMKVIHGWKRSGFALIIVFIVSYLANRYFISCTIFKNIHYFFIGVLIYFCWRDNKLKECALSFLGIALAEIIINRMCYPSIFASIICIVLEMEIILPSRITMIIDIIDEHSYTLYLVHGMVFRIITHVIKLRSPIYIPLSVIGMILIVFSIISTVFIHKYIELPLQIFLKKKMIKQ